MALRKAVEKASNPKTKLESIMRSLSKDDREYLLELLHSNTPCSIISEALFYEGYEISERTLQKERVKLGSKADS